MSEMERPADDSVEQVQDVIPEETEPIEDGNHHEVPLEADEADAADQERDLGPDEDDYR